jgi:hypothetical protein
MRTTMCSPQARRTKGSELVPFDQRIATSVRVVLQPTHVVPNATYRLYSARIVGKCLDCVVVLLAALMNIHVNPHSWQQQYIFKLTMVKIHTWRAKVKVELASLDMWYRIHLCACSLPPNSPDRFSKNLRSNGAAGSLRTAPVWVTIRASPTPLSSNG